jgi:hypothetical protein
MVNDLLTLPIAQRLEVGSELSDANTGLDADSVMPT